MKTTAAVLLSVLLVAPVRSEIFRPGGGRGAPPPAGPRGDHRPAPPPRWEGHHRGDRVSVRVGYGWFAPGYARYPGYAYGYYPGYGPDYPYAYGVGVYAEPSAASTGLLLGALAGGIIGNNSGAFGHSGARGAAWGAGAGLLLGAVADARRARETYFRPTAPTVVYAPAPAPSVTPALAPAPQQVTIINNYYGVSPMSGANSLFGR